MSGVTFKTLGEAVRNIDRARRVMGRKGHYRIENAKTPQGALIGFRIACYSVPVPRPYIAAKAGLFIEWIDGQARAFIRYY